jgi:hypothetical protein
MNILYEILSMDDMSWYYLSYNKEKVEQIVEWLTYYEGTIYEITIVPISSRSPEE